eukprot:189436-Hanusia_phi.AAC.4
MSIERGHKHRKLLLTSCLSSSSRREFGHGAPACRAIATDRLLRTPPPPPLFTLDTTHPPKPFRVFQ